jgi:hypothetical protein
MPTVMKRPSDFVNYLRNPGLRTNGGRVPITCYLSFTKGCAAIKALVAALPVVVDTDSNLNIYGTVGKTQVGLISKGQGDPEACVTFMNFVWDNQEALETFPGTLKRVYDKYFAKTEETNALARMAAASYFGYCCIGFVGQYLRHAGLWRTYTGIDIDQWATISDFSEPVNSAGEVGALNLMVWPRGNGGHVALVDRVHSYSGNQVVIDMCQSSGGGPQCNRKVTLTASGDTLNGHKKFLMKGGVPAPPVVPRECYIIAWPDLRFGGPVHQSGGKAAGGTY